MDLQELISANLDHIRGMWRYRWQFVIVAWLVAISGWAAVYKLPNVYAASALVSVDTNSLFPTLTKGLTASENLLSEVDIVSRALLARPNLEKVARDTDIDLRADTPQEMELLITGLQQRVKIMGGREDDIFAIAFEDRSREKARAVVQSLLNTLVESSLGAQGDDTDMTVRALSMEIQDHEQRLLTAEAALAEFKKRNLGYMPGDGTDYYTRLQSALADVAESERQVRLLSERRDEISRQLEGEEPVFGLMPSTPAQAAAGCSNAGGILQLRAQLSRMQIAFTDKHPRIVMLKETLSQLESDCEKEREAMGGAVPVLNSETNSLDVNPVYQNLRLQLSNANVELAALREEYNSRRREVDSLRADVDKIGEVETDFKKLNRDYGVVEGRHQELLRRWETLQSKKRLDPVTDQVQFNILEPPFAAAEPVAPNRPLLLIGVLVIAIGAGGVVAFGLNQLKPVFYTRHSFCKVVGMPVLGSVSKILSPAQIAANKRKTLVWVGANVALLLTAGVVVVLENPILRLANDLLGGGIL